MEDRPIPDGPVADPADTGALLARAVAIAARVHEVQRDKAGAPYILHPLRLMARAATDAERIVGVLHDVVEDSAAHPDPALRYPLARLRAEGFTGDLADALDLVTSRPGEDYAAFVERIAAAPGRAGHIARRVKLLDLEDNMTLTRLAEPGDKDWERLRRYHAAHRRLTAVVASED
jgi:hypothetical protein